MVGSNGDDLMSREWQVANGRLLLAVRVASGGKVAILGSVIIDELFDGRARVGEVFSTSLSP